MQDLRDCFESLGFSKVETFIASGNVIFESRSKKAEALSRKIERALARSLGYEVATFLRTEAELADIVRYKPFPDSKIRRAKALNVAFLAEPPTREAQAALMRLRSEIDEFHVHGREVYWLSRGKQSESKVSNAVLEKALRARVTLRGFPMLVRLAVRYPPPGS